MTVVILPAKTLIARYDAANPMHHNDAVCIALCRPDFPDFRCPITGAHLTTRKRGFMTEVTVRGYAADRSDERACVAILRGQ